MSKSQRSYKVNKNEVVHHELYDDNLLPSADELAKLQNIRPDLVDWAMNYVNNEQSHRQKSYDERTVILKDSIKRDRALNSRGMIFCFIVLIFGMSVGGYLISKGNYVTGTLFAGADLIIAAGLLYNKNEKDKAAK